MTDREIIKTELGRLKTGLVEEGEDSMFEQGRISAFEDMEVFIDSLPKDSPIVYVVTRCEEHDDYVEEVFFDENKAVEYCKQFEGDQDEYARHMTTVKATL